MENYRSQDQLAINGFAHVVSYGSQPCLPKRPAMTTGLHAVNICDFSASLGTMTPKTTMLDSNILVSSPYKGQEHHLDLSSVSENSKWLGLALQDLHPTTDDYPSQPYAESFNWQQVVDTLPPDFSGITQ